MFLSKLIERVMQRAILRALANGITDPVEIRIRMILARNLILNAWDSR
jgi:hypothetical protein